jgi:NitT/TauT family transport system ATP-binding protein
MAAALKLASVSKRFDVAGQASVYAVKDLNFATSRGEFVSVIGPSGCGKSTILNMVSGLDLPTEGEIRLDEAVVTGPSERVGFMLQKDLLLPWRSIVENVAFGMEARRIPRAERRDRALQELVRCQLEGVADYYPHQLSGGMRQRAALARTLAVRPDLILLDEPFSALDAQTKLVLQRSFAKTIGDEGVSAVLITHDLQEAVLMSDRILLLLGRPGRLAETIKLDLPDRRDPLARRKDRRTLDYVEYLFAALSVGQELV